MFKVKNGRVSKQAGTGTQGGLGHWLIDWGQWFKTLTLVISRKSEICFYCDKGKAIFFISTADKWIRLPNFSPHVLKKPSNLIPKALLTLFHKRKVFIPLDGHKTFQPSNLLSVFLPVLGAFPEHSTTPCLLLFSTPDVWAHQAFGFQGWAKLKREQIQGGQLFIF